MRAASLDEEMDRVLDRSSINNQLVERRRKLGLNE
jgi:hypothetical protein